MTSLIRTAPLPHNPTAKPPGSSGSLGVGLSSEQMLIWAGNAITVFTELEASGAPRDGRAPRDRRHPTSTPVPAREKRPSVGRRATPCRAACTCLCITGDASWHLPPRAMQEWPGPGRAPRRHGAGRHWGRTEDSRLGLRTELGGGQGGRHPR